MERTDTMFANEVLALKRILQQSSIYELGELLRLPYTPTHTHTHTHSESGLLLAYAYISENPYNSQNILSDGNLLKENLYQLRFLGYSYSFLRESNVHPSKLSVQGLGGRPRC